MRSTLFAAFGAGALLAGLVVGGIAVAQPEEPETIQACKLVNGFVRVVDSADDCKVNETPLEWDVEGPPGPAGPAVLYAAATVDVANIINSVGPIESVTFVGLGHYRVDFADEVLGDLGDNTSAFISLATNSPVQGTYCTYGPFQPDKLDIHCWNGAAGGDQPEDAEWSLSLSLPTP